MRDQRLFALVTLTMCLAACSSTGNDAKYSRQTSTAADGVITLHLESTGDMSEPDMKRSLLSEAAHSTIDGGRLFLRVLDLSTERGTDMKPASQSAQAVAPLNPQPAGMPPPASSGMTFGHHREGMIRFSTFRELPAGAGVFDASKLLDQLRDGVVPSV